MAEHIIDKICSCKHCQMIDIMFGDPTLSPWESKFIESLCRYGWLTNYTPKQKTCLEKLFDKQIKRWAQTK